MKPATAVDPASASDRVAALDVWYHTIDVAPGVATPGYYDLRHAVDGMPWPDVEGKRCLDVGTFDGFFAFELERRGAAEVVAVDLADHQLLDWPADARPANGSEVPSILPPKGVGFRLAADILGSQARWRALSIYDLDPDVVGTFDVVVVGSLLLHLRDPVRALEAVRSVCDGWLLSSEHVDLALTLLTRRPVFRLDGSGTDAQWWIGNPAGHERLLLAAGFQTAARSRLFTVRYNRNPRPPSTVKNRLRQRIMGILTGDHTPGALHRAVVARPRL